MGGGANLVSKSWWDSTFLHSRVLRHRGIECGGWGGGNVPAGELGQGAAKGILAAVIIGTTAAGAAAAASSHLVLVVLLELGLALLPVLVVF